MMKILLILAFLIPVLVVNVSIARFIKKMRSPFKQIGWSIQSLVFLGSVGLYATFILNQEDIRGMFIFIVTSAVISIIYSIHAMELLARKWRKPFNWLTPLIFTLVTFGGFFFSLMTTRRWNELRENNPDLLDFAIGLFFTLMAVCITVAIFQILQDLTWLTTLRKKEKRPKSLLGEPMDRSTFITKLGMIAGGMVLGSFAWGLTRGKFGFRVMEQDVYSFNLPAEFDGLTIVQISDLHLGSFNRNFDPIIEAVQIINSLEPDIICFTGDLVNTYHTEALDWVPIIKDLSAKERKFSILGNHDYGYYGDTTEEQQEECRAGVIEMNKAMDFDILVNEHRILQRGNAKLCVVGVENWGESKWFPKNGDMVEATKGMESVDFTLLLSHDPTHWDAKVVKQENIDLTLSGHTHGAQMGLRIPGILEISPAQLMFKRWAGLYQEGEQQLYINRGMGYLMMPGRVGMPPEITKITLRKA
ncbi:MAG: metallophosphoesterase [Bacteroidota bacterium]